MKSDAIKKGVERAAHRSLLHAVGVSRSDLDKPFVGIINSFSEVVPGHIHLRSIAEAVRQGVEVIVAQARVRPDGIFFHRTLPVEL